MTDDQSPDDARLGETVDDFPPERLDGHTIDELTDYLDAGRQPRDPSIENSPGCQIAMDALRRLHAKTWEMLAEQAESDPEREQGWITRILSSISREAHAGRDIPLESDRADTSLQLTEGSVRGLVRAAGDSAGGGLIGTVRLDGDLATPGEPVVVTVTASAQWPEPLQPLAERMRRRILEQLSRHSELNIVAVNVTIEDIHFAADDEEEHADGR